MESGKLICFLRRLVDMPNFENLAYLSFYKRPVRLWSKYFVNEKSLHFARRLRRLAQGGFGGEDISKSLW